MIDSILPFFLAHFFLFWGLTHISPVSQAKRILLVFFIACCCLVAVRSTVALSVPGGVGNEYIIGFILHASNFLCLVKLQSPPKWSALARRSWALNQLIGPRWGVNYKPPFRSRDKRHIPHRAGLFLSRLWDLAWTCSAIWFLQSFPLKTVPADFLSVPNGFLHRLSEVHLREITIRVYLSVSGYIFQYFTLRACHSFASCIGLLCGQDPQRWPPLFGSIADAYTVRRWFSHFWHHCMRKAFTSHAVALCTRVLRLPKHSQLTRYLILIITFMISAIMHMFAAPELERCSIYPQFRYYGSIIAAITLEDVVIKGNRRFWRSRTSSDLSKQNGKPKGAATAYPLRQQQDEEKPALFWRLIGYIWVFGFHIWAGSKLIYGLWSHCST